MGHCLGNPGPCGSGACIFVPNETEPVMLRGPVTNRGSILLDELIAILMALEFAQGEHKKRHIHGITIFSDSQSAEGNFALGRAATAHKNAVEDNKSLFLIWRDQYLKSVSSGHRGMPISGEIVLQMIKQKRLQRK